MVDYREILRLASDPRNGQRSIAAIVHSSRDTIREVLKAAKEADVKWPLDESGTNEALKGILFPGRASMEVSYTAPDYSHIHQELANNIALKNLSPKGHRRITKLLLLFY